MPCVCVRAELIDKAYYTVLVKGKTSMERFRRALSLIYRCTQYGCVHIHGQWPVAKPINACMHSIYTYRAT